MQGCRNVSPSPHMLEDNLRLKPMVGVQIIPSTLLLPLHFVFSDLLMALPSTKSAVDISFTEAIKL